MNILIINGSPKGEKSDTLLVTNAFIEGIMTKYQDLASIEIVDVNTANINHCKGCFCCWTSTPGKCVIHDDMSDILPKIINADILIWSFPLYYYGMPSKVKALLDRNLPLNLPFMNEPSGSSYNHPQRYHNKTVETVLISTGGLSSSVNNYEALIKQFDIIYNCNYTKIICPQAGLLSQPELRNRIDEYLSYVKQAGKEYASNRQFSEETDKNLNTLLYPPQAYIQMANASWDIKYETDKISESDKNKISAKKFTLQMAAMYNPNSFDGIIKVLEMYYTDLDITYQLIMRKNKCEVHSSDFTQYTTRIETPITVWKDISQSKYSGEQAMMEGKYKTFGDLKLMISWNRYFGADSSNDTKSHSLTNKKTNIAIMIMMWSIMWVLLSINTMVGGIAGITIVAGIHFANIKWELTIYDYITCLCISTFSLSALMGCSMQIIIPLSYLCFGLMWLFSCLTAIPLTANYSKNVFNGNDALKSPLFIKTNLILTICWGVLYLIMPIWTYFIMGSSMSYLTIFINTICPIFLGIFTAWFQKWYPAKFARG